MGTRLSMANLTGDFLGQNSMRQDYVTDPNADHTGTVTYDDGREIHDNTAINISAAPAGVEVPDFAKSRAPSDLSAPIPAAPDDGLSNSRGVAGPETPSAEESLANIAEQNEKNRRTNTMLAGAKFALDVMNAQSAYASHAGAAHLNVLNARMQARDAFTRGRQRSLEARSEGERMGDDALLRLAAQGQDVSGAGARSVEGSYEVMGVYNALQEETNAIKEALGFELQEVAIDYDLDQRANQRDSTIISSALNYGATAYGNTL